MNEEFLDLLSSSRADTFFIGFVVDRYFLTWIPRPELHFNLGKYSTQFLLDFLRLLRQFGQANSHTSGFSENIKNRECGQQFTGRCFNPVDQVLDHDPYHEPRSS